MTRAVPFGSPEHLKRLREADKAAKAARGEAGPSSAVPGPQGERGPVERPAAGTEPPATQAPQLGKLVPPYPVDRCALATCRATLAGEAFLYRDVGGDEELLAGQSRLVVFCGDCAPHIDLNHGLRFRLVAL